MGTTVQLTEEQVREAIRIFARRGGKASVESFTPAERSARAKHASRVRWDRRRAALAEAAAELAGSDIVNPGMHIR